MLCAILLCQVDILRQLAKINGKIEAKSKRALPCQSSIVSGHSSCSSRDGRARGHAVMGRRAHSSGPSSFLVSRETRCLLATPITACWEIAQTASVDPDLREWLPTAA